jgi:hypothetical protein
MEREELVLALEKIERFITKQGYFDDFDGEITAIKEDLAQPAQEPVAWLHPVNETCVTTDPTAYARGIPLYATPPQRSWVGLTTEDMATCINEPAWDLILRKAEQILKEKNQ